VRTIADGQDSPQDLALTDDLVFWTNEWAPDPTRDGRLMVAPR
jgi:hypothetical protein